MADNCKTLADAIDEWDALSPAEQALYNAYYRALRVRGLLRDTGNATAALYVNSIIRALAYPGIDRGHTDG